MRSSRSSRYRSRYESPIYNRGGWSKEGEQVTAGPPTADLSSSCPSQRSSAARAAPAPIQSSFSRSGTPPASTPGCCRWPRVGGSMLPTRRSPPMWGSVPPLAADLAWRSPSTYTRRTCPVSTPRISCAEPTRSALTRTPRVATSTSRSASTAHSWNDRRRDAEFTERSLANVTKSPARGADTIGASATSAEQPGSRAVRKHTSPFGATPLAAPPKRPLLERRAARRSTAQRGMDMPSRSGEGAASRVVRGEGLGKGGFGRRRGEDFKRDFKGSEA